MSASEFASIFGLPSSPPRTAAQYLIAAGIHAGILTPSGSQYIGAGRTMSAGDAALYARRTLLPQNAQSSTVCHPGRGASSVSCRRSIAAQPNVYADGVNVYTIQDDGSITVEPLSIQSKRQQIMQAIAEGAEL